MLDLFWQLANCDVEDLVKQLCQELPKNVKNCVDSIEKCVWILRQKFKFTTTKKLNLKRLTSLKRTLNMLKQLKFPVLIGVSSKQSSYNHVVVIWNGIVIDYESMHTYTLTEESLRQVCGTNTTFQKVVSGYGLFPPNDLRKKVTNLTGRIGGESLNSTKAMTVQFVVFFYKIIYGAVTHTLHLYIILELKYCPHSLLGKVQNNLLTS